MIDYEELVLLHCQTQYQVPAAKAFSNEDPRPGNSINPHGCEDGGVEVTTGVTHRDSSVQTSFCLMHKI